MLEQLAWRLKEMLHWPAECGYHSQAHGRFRSEIQRKIDVFTHTPPPLSTLTPHQPHPAVKLGSEGFPPDKETTLAQSMEVMSVQSEGIPTTPPSSRCNLNPIPLYLLPLPPSLLPFLPHSHFPASPAATAKGAASAAQPKFSDFDTVACGLQEERREERFFLSFF